MGGFADTDCFGKSVIPDTKVVPHVLSCLQHCGIEADIELVFLPEQIGNIIMVFHKHVLYPGNLHIIEPDIRDTVNALKTDFYPVSLRYIWFAE
jgi:hypothetical protein